MIASVVVTLEDSTDPTPEVIGEISALPGVEIGEFGNHARRLPVTIDSSVPNALDETTRHLQDCRGVAFVDVVFVHLENEPERNVTATPEGASN